MVAGYTVDPETVFRVSIQYLDTKTFVYGIADGTAGDLSASAGMAGDDSTAHDFASKYEPCARTVVKAMGTAGQAMSAVSGRLLTMAWNYLKTEDSVAASFNGGQIDTASGMQRQPKNCEPSEAYVALPAVTGAKQSSSIPVISRFWPQGDPDKLRAAAQVWQKAAELIDNAQTNGARQAMPIFIYCSGDAVDAFGKYAATVFTGQPSGGTTVAASQPLMENISAGCRLLANACNAYASSIDNLRSTITNLAIAAGVISVAGIIGTIFTLGLSDEAAGAGDAALVADAAAAAGEFATAESSSAAAAAIAEAEAIVAEAASQLNVEVASATTTASVSGVTMPQSLAQSVVLDANQTSLVGPIGPNTPPAFPLYTPAQQAAAAAWANTLPSRAPNYGNADDQAYQLRVAGTPERLMSSANGGTVWADGFRSTDGAIIDAKNVRQQGCSPRTLNGLQQSDFATNLLSGKDANELYRYGDAINNPTNHAQFLELDTNDPETVGYWQFLCAQQHVKSDVRYVP
jgi:hypothetical protein